MSCLTHLKVDCRGGGVGNFSVLAALTYTGKYNEQYIRLTEGGGGETELMMAAIYARCTETHRQ